MYFLIFLAFLATVSGYDIDYVTPDDCTSDQYYDISSLSCQACPATNQITDEDGTGCTCDTGYKSTLTSDTESVFTTTCEECPDGKVTSSDGWSCISCPDDTLYSSDTKSCTSCDTDDILQELDTDGSSLSKGKCVLCVNNTEPYDGSCTRCSTDFVYVGSSCSCDGSTVTQIGSMCFPSDANVLSSASSTVFYTSVSQSSYYIEENLAAAYAACSNYLNTTACQMLGNLCVLQMYYLDDDQNACDAYTTVQSYFKNDLQYDDIESIVDWIELLPWLYYLEETATEVLSREGIPITYSTDNSDANSKISIVAAKYYANGTFIDLVDATSGELRLCSDGLASDDYAFKVGVNYEITCDVDIQAVWDDYETIFYELYVSYTDKEVDKLYAVPVLIQNYESQNEYVNQLTRDGWQLTRRFFLIDNLSGIKSLGSPATTVRYIKTMQFKFQLVSDSSGSFYTPYIILDYGEISYDDYPDGGYVSTSFNIDFFASFDQYEEDMSIAVGVLAVLAAIYSGVKATSWRKRAGIIIIDLLSMLKFILFYCGDLANVLLAVNAGASIYNLMIFRFQGVIYTLPPSYSQESLFRLFLYLAFALKCVQIFHLIMTQVIVDIFLIDWERPRGKALQQSSGDTPEKQKSPPVSIWRTYFIANEWNEIQTIRKTKPIFQLFVTLLFLKVIGLENWARYDPNITVDISNKDYLADYCLSLRFAVLCLVFITTGVAQWIFFTFFYNRFIEDDIQQFVDLCSISNVSVFMMCNSQYGYYIHGRSVHGYADTDIREMHAMLQREADNLCGQRGLLPNTDQQTFQMSLPKRLRDQYKKVLAPMTGGAQQPGRMAPTGAGAAGRAGRQESKLDYNVERMILGYQTMNRFLSSFIDHSIHDLDYVVKEKLFFERLLDIELYDSLEKGIFYHDGGHSFDKVLFYGNEMALFIFDLLLFAMIDHLTEDFIAAAVVTYFVGLILAMLRDSLGSRNLAKKTLVDERFLI